MSILLISTVALAGAAVSGSPGGVPQETLFSKSLRFTGDVVEVQPSGRAIRQTAIIRGRAFTWQRKLTGLVAAPESKQAAPTPPLELDDPSVEQLAQELRALVMFAGHEFIEAEPAYDVARAANRYHQRQREGASPEELASLLPFGIPSQGSAGPTRSRAGAERQAGQGGVARSQVHGFDDRDLLDNTVYPHRTQIMFDNGGLPITSGNGSGTLIGPSTAMSAAHVFWNEAAGDWEADHRWAPGFDDQDADPSPWGEFGCYLVTIPAAYTSGNEDRHDYAVIDFDVGCNVVSNGVNSDEPGNTVGWLGWYVPSQSEIQSTTGFVRGYPGFTQTCGNPGVTCNSRIWGDTSTASETNATANEIHHQADTSDGMSGSGFYHYVDPSCAGCGDGAYLVGIHRAGGASYNVARRFDSTVSAFMEANSSDY